MDLARTPFFNEESARFRLRFTCDDCGFFDLADERCRHRWPTEAHRRAVYERPLDATARVVFCKEFEVR